MHQDLAWSRLVPVMVAVHGGELPVRNASAQLLDAVLRQCAVRGTEYQGVCLDLGRIVPPDGWRSIAPAMQRDQRPPVVVGAWLRLSWDRSRRIGRIRWRHLLQYQKSDELRPRGCQLVRRNGTHGVTDDDGGKNPGVLHEPGNVVTHGLEGVVVGPFAVAVPAGVRRDHSKAVAKRRRDVPPAQA